MTDALSLALAVSVFLLSGYLVLTLADLAVLRMGLLVRLSAAFLLGLGAVSLELLVFSVLSVPYRAVFVAAPWAALLALVVFLPAKRETLLGASCEVKFLRRLHWMEKAFLIVIVSQAAYSFSYALLFPVTGWDSWQTWFFKARVFFIDGGLKRAFFLTNDLIHADYPLLIPLSATWVYVAVGRANEIMARLIYPLQFVSLLGVFYYLVRSYSSRRHALLFTALLSMTHLLMRHAADFPLKIPGVPTMDFVGYADLALSAYFVAAAGFFYLYLNRGERAHLFLFAVFLGLGAWTKDEGLPFAAVGALLALTHMLGKKRPAAEFLILISALAVTAGPWMLYKAYIHIPQENRGALTLSNAFAHIGAVPVILKAFIQAMFLNIPAFNFIWYLYPATVVLNRRCFFSKSLIFLNIMLLFQFSVYVLVYLTSSIDLTVHISTSIERVVMHMVPLAMFISAANLWAFLYRRGARRDLSFTGGDITPEEAERLLSDG